MGIVKELIDDLSKSESSLTDILIRTKVLAHKLKNKEIKEWVSNELEGYKDLDKLPKYRIHTCRVIGTVSNGVQRVSNYPIPLYSFSEHIRNDLLNFKIAQSVSAIENIVSESETKSIANEIPSDFYEILSTGCGNGYLVEYAKRVLAISQILQTVTSIKTKLLDFLMELDDIVDEDNLESANKSEIQNIFKDTVFGDGTVIQIGNKNQQTVTNTINKGSFNELEKVLKENSVEQADIVELQSVIDTEQPDFESKKFGSKVNDWITKMVGKALNGTWQIGVGAAGELLADVIGKYYGLNK